MCIRDSTNTVVLKKGKLQHAAVNIDIGQNRILNDMYTAKHPCINVSSNHDIGLVGGRNEVVSSCVLHFHTTIVHKLNVLYLGGLTGEELEIAFWVFHQFHLRHVVSLVEFPPATINQNRIRSKPGVNMTLTLLLDQATKLPSIFPYALTLVTLVC